MTSLNSPPLLPPVPERFLSLLDIGKQAYDSNIGQTAPTWQKFPSYLNNQYQQLLATALADAKQVFSFPKKGWPNLAIGILLLTFSYDAVQQKKTFQRIILADSLF